MVQLTTQSKKVLVKIFDEMTPSEKERFGRELTKLWYRIVTGDEEREFKITLQDISFLIKKGKYGVRSKLLA